MPARRNVHGGKSARGGMCRGDAVDRFVDNCARRRISVTRRKETSDWQELSAELHEGVRICLLYTSDAADDM
eukprot:8358806-Alexandrium_andersonii.AAC.1